MDDSGSPSETGDLCDYDSPTSSSLGWSEDAPDGVSAKDLFGWAIGSFEADLYWDDGTSTRFSLTTAPGDVTLITYGPEGECAGPSMGLIVSVTAGSGDGRLALSYEGSWFAEETSDVGRLGSLNLDHELSAETMGIEPLAEGSVVYLNLRLDDDDGLYFSLVERWNTEPHSERLCVRAAMQASDLGCEDSIEDTGIGDE